MLSNVAIFPNHGQFFFLFCFFFFSTLSSAGCFLIYFFFPLISQSLSLHDAEFADTNLILSKMPTAWILMYDKNSKQIEL